MTLFLYLRPTRLTPVFREFSPEYDRIIATKNRSFSYFRQFYPVNIFTLLIGILIDAIIRNIGMSLATIPVPITPTRNQALTRNSPMNQTKTDYFNLNLTLLLICLALILQALPARSADFCPTTHPLPATERPLLQKAI